jgi:hypothetical protein
MLLSLNFKSVCAGRMAQVVEYLPSNLKALSSNPTTKKKKPEKSVCAASLIYSFYALLHIASPGKDG